MLMLPHSFHKGVGGSRGELLKTGGLLEDLNARGDIEVLHKEWIELVSLREKVNQEAGAAD
jgi:hypothetical protein